MGDVAISFFNQSGTLLGSVEASAPRGWTLNRASQCKIEIARGDPAIADDKLVRYGNLMLVESDEVGDWGGIITTPRNWGQDRITVYGYSAEWVLAGRRSPAGVEFSGTAGDIFADMLGVANNAGGMPIHLGIVDRDGGSHVRTGDAGAMYDTLVSLSDSTGQDWIVRPVYESGRLYFVGEWRVRVGEIHNQILNSEDDFELPTTTAYVEDGQIGNDVQVYGQGANWSVRKISQPLQDLESVGKYGLWQVGASIESESQAAVDEAAAVILDNNRRGSTTINLVGVNPSKFDFMNAGDSFDLALIGFGFGDDGTLGVETRVRVIGRTYSEEDGKMPVTLGGVIIA